MSSAHDCDAPDDGGARDDDLRPDRDPPVARQTVLQGGRRKAYRPLAPEARERAFQAGLAAYRAGAFFEAHELWEPAWMGTDDLPEREFLQGLIKVAAAHVHRDRGNALGMRRNLEGARSRLSAAVDGAADSRGLDLAGLLRAVDDRLQLLSGASLPPADAVPPIALG